MGSWEKINSRMRKQAGQRVEKSLQIYQEDFFHINCAKWKKRQRNLFPFAGPHEYIKVLYRYRNFSYHLLECRCTRSTLKYKKTNVSHIHLLCGPVCYEAFQNQLITELFKLRRLPSVGCIFQRNSGVNLMENVPQAW